MSFYCKQNKTLKRIKTRSNKQVNALVNVMRKEMFLKKIRQKINFFNNKKNTRKAALSHVKLTLKLFDIY